MNNLDSLFISHGSPDEILHNSPARRFWRSMGSVFAGRALVVMSAHDEADTLTVGANPTPHTIHDFGRGFPNALFERRHNAVGDAGLAKNVAQRLCRAGYEVTLDRRRGWDHGVWTALGEADPEGALRIVTVSGVAHRDARFHYEVGQALSGMGALLIGSGALTHNLGAVQWKDRDAAPDARARAFADWITDRILKGDHHSLLKWRDLAPNARWNHPTPEHLMPLFFALGAAQARLGQRLHQSYSMAALAMHAFGF